VPGVWQRVLPVTYIGRAQDSSPRRVAAQVSGVQAQLQPAQQSQDASAHAHRSQAVRVLLVQQSVPAELRSATAHAHARCRRRARRRSVGRQRCRYLVGRVSRGRGRAPVGGRRR